MENVFADFPLVDEIYMVGDDYYLTEPKHLIAEGVEVKVVFRNEKAKALFEAKKGLVSESDKDERITALSLELEDVKAEMNEIKAEKEALILELEGLKTSKPPKAEK
jgi:hypothetical protein